MGLIALTSCVGLMKVSERVVLQHLQDLVADFTDRLQFAYRKHRSLDDAIFACFSPELVSSG